MKREKYVARVQSVLKIQLGPFYLQMPNNLENLRYAQKWIGFFIDYLEKQKIEEKDHSCLENSAYAQSEKEM